jgi:hypothetical protein
MAPATAGTPLALTHVMRAHASSGVFEELGRSLELQALPPARFRPPVPLSRRRAATFRQQTAVRRSRVGMGLFAGGLALVSVGIASWNAYWLAEPLRSAIMSLVG